jgi:hypothetical protein
MDASGSDGHESSDHDAYERERIEANRRYEEQRKTDHEAAEALRKAAGETAELERRERRESDG